MENIKQVLKKSKVKKIIFILGYLIIALLIFQAGMFVGYKKAGFSFRVGEQYFRQMNGKQNDQFMGVNRADFGNSNGAVGKIINIELPLVVIADEDGVEKTIIISTSTDIKKFRDSIASEDLEINDLVTVIGTPNNKAELEARLIRVMPGQENATSSIVGTSTSK